MGDSYAVDVQEVSKSFGAFKALNGVTLRVRQGEIYGLLGPNGAGKTTLIRMICGLLEAHGGTVTVLGQRMPNVAVLRHIGYMTQQAALYPALSVEENVDFFAAINGAESGVKEALELVQLYDRRKSVVSTLSGGLRQRCSLACALVHRPELLLLDEPTVGIDPQLRVQFWEEFRRDRRTLALLFVAPIVILGLLGYLMRGSSSSPSVGIANQDSGPLGAVVAKTLRHSSHITTSDINASDGDPKLRDGSLVAYVVLPSDFSSQAQAGTVAPEVHLEGSQPGEDAPVLQALQQAMTSLASQVAGRNVSFQPQVKYLYGGANYDTLDHFGAAFVGLVVFFLVFVITIVSFLNERSQGTLERLMASPLRRGEILLSGIIFPVSTEPSALQYLSNVLPLTYAVNGMRDIMVKDADLTWSSLQLDAAVVAGFCVVLIAAGTATLRRRLA